MNTTYWNKTLASTEEKGHYTHSPGLTLISMRVRHDFWTRTPGHTRGGKSQLHEGVFPNAGRSGAHITTPHAAHLRPCWLPGRRRLKSPHVTKTYGDSLIRPMGVTKQPRCEECQTVFSSSFNVLIDSNNTMDAVSQSGGSCVMLSIRPIGQYILCCFFFIYCSEKQNYLKI